MSITKGKMRPTSYYDGVRLNFRLAFEQYGTPNLNADYRDPIDETIKYFYFDSGMTEGIGKLVHGEKGSTIELWCVLDLANFL